MADDAKPNYDHLIYKNPDQKDKWKQLACPNDEVVYHNTTKEPVASLKELGELCTPGTPARAKDIGSRISLGDM